MRLSVYEPDKEDWIKIFKTQSGGGTVAYYQGQRYQRGGSIGSFLGKLWRVIPRFLGSPVGQSLVSGVTGVAKDVAAGQSFKEAAKSHAREQARNLVGIGKMRGAGKRRCPKRVPKRNHFITAM